MASHSISRQRNSTKASDPAKALRVAAEKANRALASSDASLLSLPYEIERLLIEMVIDDGDLSTKASISYRKLSNGQRHQELALSFSTVYKRLAPLLKACKQTRLSCYEYLGENVTLIEDKSDRLLYQRRKKYWSKALLSKIQRLEVKMTTSMKLKDEEQWPAYLNLFVNTMTSLHHLQLTSTWTPGARSWPRAMSGDSRNSVSHQDQERRCKLRFLSFLVRRHPRLDRIRLPASSQLPMATDVRPSGAYSHTLIAERSGIDVPGDCEFVWESVTKEVYENRYWPRGEIEFVEHHDEIINATMVRKLRWTEI